MESFNIIESLIDIGLSLSETRDLQELLDLILKESRRFTGCDAGSLYLREGEKLNFAASQNDTLGSNFNALTKEGEQEKKIQVDLNTETIAGYVASTGKVLNLADVYQLNKEVPFKFSSNFDEKSGYRTKSMLTVPMMDRSRNVIGVLQLINCLEGNTTVPFDQKLERLVQSLASQAAIAVNNSLLTKKLLEAHYDTIFRLGVAAEYRDKDTANHLKRMSNYSKIIAKQMNFDDHNQDLILHAAPMHDVGKLGIPDAILLKPGPLTPEERKIMEGHTEIGARILAGSDSHILALSQEVARCHHEKFDGNGYPRRLKGEDIPIIGRIVALADVFDALTSKRCYKDAIPFDTVCDMVKGDSGTHFDPQVIDAFFKDMEPVKYIFKTYKD